MSNIENRKEIDNTRRSFLAKTTVLSGVAFLGGFTKLALAQSVSEAIVGNGTGSSLLNFEEISIFDDFNVHVPKGYKAQVLLSWRDKIISNDAAKDFNNSLDYSSVDQESQFGDHNDGMEAFPFDDTSDKMLLVVNNETMTRNYVYNNEKSPRDLEDVKKSQATVGVSVVEISRDNNIWSVNKTSTYNRRITANTEMVLGGVAAKSPKLETGSPVLGTMANCACGKTPWGTYLTCEENFNSYMGYTDESTTIPAEFKSFGLGVGSSASWEKFDPRFDLSKNPNEANRFGWVVEINPYDPESKPVKRTSLGRFKHENAAVQIAKDGRIVVYMGDDQANEFIYKFVSDKAYIKGNDANNSSLLDDGKLYVAKFNGIVGENKGSGEWVELALGANGINETNGFNSQADVVINAREAARILGATPMDRPEWVAVNPTNGKVFCTLTNNSSRSVPNAPNPRAKNNYGQIISWFEKDADHTALTFDWDLFVIAGNPNVYDDDKVIDSPNYLRAGSESITKTNTFNSPDGIGFDGAGRVWILTDGSDSNSKNYDGQGNNSVLIGDPATGEIKRFMTVPKGAEATGLTFTSDGKTAFINVQHPSGGFPDFSDSNISRSSVIMITKDSSVPVTRANDDESNGILEVKRQFDFPAFTLRDGVAVVNENLSANIEPETYSRDIVESATNVNNSDNSAGNIAAIPTLSAVAVAATAISVGSVAIKKLNVRKEKTSKDDI